jgi:hypothetical protein
MSADDDLGNTHLFYYWSGPNKIYDLPFDGNIIADNLLYIYKNRPSVWQEGYA